MIRVAIAGASGRTGRCVVEAVLRDARFAVAAALTVADDPLCGSTVRLDAGEVRFTQELAAPCDVLIDFTLPAGTMHWLDRCLERKLPMVTGTTGLSPEQVERLRSAGRVIPILSASNFSVGIQVLRELAVRAAQALGADFDIEIVETHHRHKADAPSGTALSLLDDLLAATGQPGRAGATAERDRSTPEGDHTTAERNRATFGREGRTGPRRPGEIGVHAVRMGEVVGEHVVHFSGPGETLTLTHTAHSRATFAAGALRAAAWLVSRPPGYYTFADAFK
ncbi:MAG TPA: 4-hydroxy-tetrahydrodipicolinate reductase [Phycisphaerae bacterium]|nr:4-hydroxy-tetrahydrodipicolinate reductase [Phycisphaerae bacterium]HNU44172.1 4-hydroxy-tetrahydrodipicolinate reductase [Phycisphaerae bacterium]